MKIKYLVAVSVAAFVASGNAQAAAVAPLAEPVAAAPSFSWDGFYLGGEAGGSWSGHTVNITNIYGADLTMKTNPYGFVGGLYAGYNFDIARKFDGANTLVLGIEADFVAGSLQKTRIETTPGASATFKTLWSGSTRLRLGYAADRWLPYIAYGLAYRHAIYNLKYKYSSAGYRYSSEDAMNMVYAGRTFGAGIDYAMTDTILLRAEYRYSGFALENYASDIRGGIGYKF